MIMKEMTKKVSETKSQRVRKPKPLVLALVRHVLERGSITGTLSLDGEKICDTLERKGGCLAPGEYRVVIGKCKLVTRKMPFIIPVPGKDESDASATSSLESDVSAASKVPDPSVCQRCREERECHEMGHLDEVHRLPCAMMQPGNGVFSLRQGSMLVGEAHAPGFMLKSQELFLLLYGRVYKALLRGKEVKLTIK